MNPIDRIEQLRARVTELEKELEHAQQCVKFHSENSVARHARAEQAEQRNAELVEQLKAYGKYAHDTTLEDQNDELVAALRDTKEVLNDLMRLPKAGGYPDGPCLETSDWHEIRHTAKKIEDTLARAESATPAKHPDTERLVTLLESALKSFAAMPEANPSHTRDGIWALWTDGCNTLRDAIDAARKQPPTT